MLKDLGVVQALRDEWETVRTTQKFIGANVSWSFASGGHLSGEFVNLANSLCLLFGFSVLEHALEALRAEGHFNSSSWDLARLMADSRKAIRWVDFDLVFEGKDRRDGIAHHRVWLDLKDTRKYLDAIEAELRDWGRSLGNGGGRL